MASNQFSCPDCEENYTADGSNPVMPIALNCGHDMCLDCAKKRLCNKGALYCPDSTCNKKHKRFPLDSLPVIWSLLRRNQNIMTSGKAHPSVNKKITLNIKDLERNMIQIETLPTTSMANLFELVAARRGNEMGVIRLIYKGKQLEEDPSRSISELGIADKSTLYLVMRLVGE